MAPRPDQPIGGLRAARKRLHLSRGELAAVAGVSAETIKAYERGSRPPTHQNLERLLAALQMERVEANAIRQAAGFAPVQTLFADFPDYGYTIDELQATVEEVPWPEFVVNDPVEVVACNRAACALWGIDFQRERERRAPAEMNLMAVAAERNFTQHVENWDEVVRLLASVLKGQLLRHEGASESDPYLSHVLEQFVERDHAFLARLIDAWNTAMARPPKVRWSYRVIWRDSQFGPLRFHCIVSTANEQDGLAFNDWHAVDAQTWERLERVKARRSASG